MWWWATIFDFVTHNLDGTLHRIPPPIGQCHQKEGTSSAGYTSRQPCQGLFEFCPARGTAPGGKMETGRQDGGEGGGREGEAYGFVCHISAQA